jgi:hypothetical protein
MDRQAIVRLLDKLDETDFESLEKHTRDYQKKLRSAGQRAIDKARTIHSIDNNSVLRLIEGLKDELVSLGEGYLPQAMRLGYGSQPISDEFKLRAWEVVAMNNKYLWNNFIPKFRSIILTGHKQEEYDEEDEEYEDLMWLWLDENEADLLANLELYGGAYWAAIWEGMGLSIQNFMDKTGMTLKIERILDPIAQHCHTCPSKARIYNSWMEMIIVCGGVPADGSDECMSNCRCRLRVIIS